MIVQHHAPHRNIRTSKKRPHDIDEMLKRIRTAVEQYPKAMLFDLYERGYKTPFEILVACMISIRTLDEVSLAVSLRLFGCARGAFEISKLPLGLLDELLRPATYHRQKAERILEIASYIHRKYNGDLPCNEHLLLALPGVGPKTAHLVMGIACGVPKIGVDVHVERVTVRWGYVRGGSAPLVESQLARKLPKKYWVDINALLVPFGKHICTGRRPFCSQCPVLEYCRQVGVTDPR
jgi:endonuclease-3